MHLCATARVDNIERSTKEKMKRKIAYLFMYIMLGIMPLLMHCMFGIISGIQFEYDDYFPEIYFINVFIFAYNFIGYNSKIYLSNKIKGISLIVIMASFMMSTITYTISFYPHFNLYDLKFKVFIMLIILTLFNLLFTLITEIILIIRKEDDDFHYSENIYKKGSENRYKQGSENRYESYLLERIDEKLNSIKNLQSEKREEESNDAINPEGLMSGSDILAEMLKNHIEIQEYFKISKIQSKFSFYFSIVSSVVGFIVVIIAASGIVIFKSLGISIIAAVSGALTEIISGIVLWIHNKSALQLNYYYDSLHENEKFLSAVNIADKLSEEKKEDMYIEIIRKQIDIQSRDKVNNESDTDKK